MNKKSFFFLYILYHLFYIVINLHFQGSFLISAYSIARKTYLVNRFIPCEEKFFNYFFLES